MAYMVWSDSLDTGINVIDKQHRRIVEYINALYDAYEAGEKEGAMPVLDRLIHYTMTHFAFEEGVMEEGGYPYLKAHRRVHQLFTKKVGEYLERANKGEDVTLALLEMLKRWLVGHIKNDDADYVESARQVGRIQAVEAGQVSKPLLPKAPLPQSATFADAVRRLFA